ncbi:MAG: AMP-binding protein [Proteobacteria bacterium]|nr:AMP-binding protein [Pseudomonadota bacterium]
MSLADATAVGDVLAQHARRRGDAPALVLTAREPVTFGALGQLIGGLQAQFADAGIGPGSRVGLAFPRGVEAALFSLAVCSAATLVPINIGLPPTELAREMRRLKLHALLCPEGEAPAWADHDAEVGLFAARIQDGAVTLRQVRPVSRPPATDAARLYAAIFKTSGTTGASKRVPVTHENLIEMARKMERWMALSPSDRAACIMPIYYNAGFKATLLAPLLIGCSVAFSESGQPKAFVEEMGALRPTWLTAAPAWLQSLVDVVRQGARAPEHSLRFVLSTASYLPPATADAVRRVVGVPVGEFYGMCEAGMVTRPSLGTDSPAGSVGEVPKDQLVLRTEDGRPAAVGEAGEIMLRGPSVMPGYLMDDIDAAPAGLIDGWLATGDLGMLDEHGILKVIARKKEIINRGGEKVSPYDVERALLAHPAVRQAAAFPTPHERLGESVCSAVVLHSGAEATSLELLKFIEDRLAPFQRPRSVHLLPELPVGPTGKISRPQLSQMFSRDRTTGSLPDEPVEFLIAGAWQKILKRDVIGAEEDFFEIGGDSLLATEMLVQLEKMVHRKISPSEVGTRLTIRGLAQLLSQSASSEGEIGCVARDGDGIPLFLCHGDPFGRGLYGFRLAEMLETDGPVHLLHSFLEDRTGIDSIERMVSLYLPYIDAVAPAGPVRLAGYCHGGHAALELARRLEAAGRTVEKVVLLDTISLNARAPLRMAAPIVRMAAKAAPNGAARQIDRIGMTALWKLSTRLLSGDRAVAFRVAQTLKKGTMRAWDDSRLGTYYRAMAKYVPAGIEAEILCLVCEDNAAKPQYAARPWRSIAKNVRALTVPGNHATCVSEHAASLADCLNEAIPADAGRSGSRGSRISI